MHDPGRVERLQGGERVVEDDHGGGRREPAGDIDEMAHRDRVHPFVDDRRVPVIECDDREQVLMTQHAQHRHVVADLAAIGGV